MSSNKFRNYKDSDRLDLVEKTYKEMLLKQNLHYVKNKKYKCKRFCKNKYDLWDLLEKLNTIYDDSDPDTEASQIVHLYQTAESLKLRYFNDNKIKNDISIKNLFTKEEWENLPDEYKEKYNTTLDKFYKFDDWDWLILIGFIHDLGKIMLLENFGGLPQWSVVGDTFPICCNLDPNYVFYDKGYHLDNKDLNKNIYEIKCGFDKMYFSWGHDEYLASKLEVNKTNLPKEAIYLIRYHSFYSWHTPRDGNRGYTIFANEKDWEMLPLLKLLQKSDLYSKCNSVPNFDMIKNSYDILLNKYINNCEILL